MKQDYNQYFLEREVVSGQMVDEMREALAVEVENQIEVQIPMVCAALTPDLVEDWEEGGCGEDSFGVLHFEVPQGPVAQVYRETLNALVQEKLQVYGFRVEFDCAKNENPEMAKVYFNFVRAFYTDMDVENWCSRLAKKYFSGLMEQTLKMLQRFVEVQQMLDITPEKDKFVYINLEIPKAFCTLVKEKVMEAMAEELTYAECAEDGYIVFGTYV